MISVEVNILSFRTLISGFHYPECAASDLAVVNISRFQVSRLILQHCGQEEKRGECEKHLIKNGLFHALIWLKKKPAANPAAKTLTIHFYLFCWQLLSL